MVKNLPVPFLFALSLSQSHARPRRICTVGTKVPHRPSHYPRPTVGVASRRIGSARPSCARQCPLLAAPSPVVVVTPCSDEPPPWPMLLWHPRPTEGLPSIRSNANGPDLARTESAPASAANMTPRHAASAKTGSTSQPTDQPLRFCRKPL